MAKNKKMRLCGGTFFTLLLEARKPRYCAREHFTGSRDGLSDPEALIGLAKIVDPDYIEPSEKMMRTVKSSTCDYKQCINKGGSYFPFDDKTYLKCFDQKILNNYAEVLNAMVLYCEKFIAMRDSTKKDEILIKALVELIDMDDSISPEQIFYVCEDGTGIYKKHIVKETSICFQSFLLGVFHFAVMRKEDADIGKDTYNDWCPSKGGAKRTYEGNMGESINHKINLSYASVVQCTEAEVVEEGTIINESVEPENQDDYEPDTKSAPQMTFNFNVTGNNNSFYNHVDTVNNYYGGKKDGE